MAVTVLDEIQRAMEAGDVAALDAVARQYGARLLAVARRCCRSPADAEDAVQQALLNAHGSLPTYRGDGDPIAWLSTLVARSCFKMNRAPHDDPARTDHGGVDENIPCAECTDARTIAMRHEVEARLNEALMELTRTDRVAFLLQVEGFTSHEIAQRFDLTDDAVRSRLKRARKTLRGALADLVTHPDTRDALKDEPEHIHERSRTPDRRHLR